MTPMHLGVKVETEVFLLSYLCGVGLGLMYECLRIFRAVISHKKFVIQAEDFLYALFFGAVYFIFAVAETGQMRFFTLVGMLSGAVVERALLGNFIVSLIAKIKVKIKNDG